MCRPVVQGLNKTLGLWFQKWHEELGEFSLELSKSEKLYIDGIFLSKAYVLATKFQRNYVEFCTLKGDAKSKGKLTCGFKNDLRNLVNFHVSSQKSGNLHFDGFLLPKAYKNLDEKVQKRSCFMKNELGF